jgi:hypothetical protein
MKIKLKNFENILRDVTRPGGRQRELQDPAERDGNYHRNDRTIYI